MPPRPNLLGATRPTLERLGRQTPVQRLEMARELSDQLQEVQAQIAASRRSAVRELRRDGWTLLAIARIAGITVSRVKQIEQGDTTP